MALATLTPTSAWWKTKAEIRKCEVLCSNCHKIEEAAKWGI